MDCSKAWNLMMRHFDRDIPMEKDGQLMEHISLCPVCRSEFNTLSAALTDLAELKTAAPSDMESRVMHTLKKVRREHQIFLPFVVSPMIILLFLLVYGFYRLLQIGPLAFFNESFRLLTLAYRAFSTAITLLERIMNTFYFRHIIIFVVVVIAICAGQYILRNCRKAKTSFNGG